MGSGSNPDCASESTGKLLKCRLLGPPQTTTSEWQGLENLFLLVCFFKSTAEFDAAGLGTLRLLRMGSSGPGPWGSLETGASTSP